MTTTLPIPTVEARAFPPSPRRSIRRLLAPLYRLADQSEHLLVNSLETFHVDGEGYSIPRFVFTGPHAKNDPMRLGIFAAIHGDEPEGALGLVRFLEELHRHPRLAEGYQIFAYPLCNPTGFEDNTRHSRQGKDLNREFWTASEEPEIFYLERELWMHHFHGIISLHGDDTSNGLYGFVRGPDLSEELLKPALRAAEKMLPRNSLPLIDGFNAQNGIIRRGYEGILSPPPDAPPQPFEIVFETPTRTAAHLQVEALLLALKSILEEYRVLISIAQNI